jgi:hypothetical protein
MLRGWETVGESPEPSNLEPTGVGGEVVRDLCGPSLLLTGAGRMAVSMRLDGKTKIEFAITMKVRGPDELDPYIWIHVLQTCLPLPFASSTRKV